MLGRYVLWSSIQCKEKLLPIKTFLTYLFKFCLCVKYTMSYCYLSLSLKGISFDSIHHLWMHFTHIMAYSRITWVLHNALCHVMFIIISPPGCDWYKTRVNEYLTNAIYHLESLLKSTIRMFWIFYWTREQEWRVVELDTSFISITKVLNDGCSGIFCSVKRQCLDIHSEERALILTLTLPMRGVDVDFFDTSSLLGMMFCLEVVPGS